MVDVVPKKSYEIGFEMKTQSKFMKVNLNTTLEQLEKILLSRFLIDDSIKKNLSLVRIDNKMPSSKEKLQTISKIQNSQKISLNLDAILNIVFPEELSLNFKMENAFIIPEIPYNLIKFNKKSNEICEFNGIKYVMKTPSNYDERLKINDLLEFSSELQVSNVQSIKAKVFMPENGYSYLTDYMEGITLDKFNLLDLTFNDKIMILYRIVEIFQSLEKHKHFFLEVKTDNILINKVNKNINVLLVNFKISKQEKDIEKSFTNILEGIKPSEAKPYHFSVGNIAYFLFHSAISPNNLIENLTKQAIEENPKINTKLQVIENFIFNVLKYDSNIGTSMEDLKFYLVANNARMFNNKFKEKSLGNNKENFFVKNDINEAKNEEFEPESPKFDKQVTNYRGTEFVKDPLKLVFRKEIAKDFQTNYWSNETSVAFNTHKDEPTLAYIAKNNKDVFIFDLKLGKQIKKIQTDHKENICCLKHFQNRANFDDYIITSSYDKSARVFALSQDFLCIMHIPNLHDCYAIYSIAVMKSSSGIILVSGCSYGFEKLKVWDFSKGAFIRDIGDNDNNLYLEGWDYNNENFVISCNEENVKITNIKGKVFRCLKAEPVGAHLFASVFEIFGRPTLFETSNNGYIRIWNIIENTLDKKVYIKGCKFGSLIRWNSRFVIVSSNKVFNIIDIEKKVLTKTFFAHDDNLGSLNKIVLPVFGESLITCSIDGKIKIWSV